MCALAVALILPLALVGCGRKGPLDLPPSAATPPPPTEQPQPAPSTTGLVDPFSATGEAQPAPAQTAQAGKPQTAQPQTSHPLWNSFILDPLIH